MTCALFREMPRCISLFRALKGNIFLFHIHRTIFFRIPEHAFTKKNIVLVLCSREVLGPTLGGSLMDLYDFPVVMTVVGFLNLAVAILLFAYQTYQHFRTKIQVSPALSISSGEDCGNPVEAGKKRIKKVAFMSSFDEQEERQTLLNDQEEICYGSSGTTK